MNFQKFNRHILVIESCNHRQTLELKNRTYSLGRQATNNIVIDSQNISRKHATLIFKQEPATRQDIYWILDGDLQGRKSHNGIFVNGKKCYAKELKDGDIINFGCDVNAVYHHLKIQSNLTNFKAINDRTTLIISQKKLGNSKDKTLKYELEKINPLVKIEEKNTPNDFEQKLSKNFDFFIKQYLLSQAEISLERALKQEEFSLYYQPQYNIKTSKIDCLEALLRWEHPKKGLILPHQFISIAEETDLMIPIGEWVLKTACEQTQTWQQLGLPQLSISVNLSPRQFGHPNLKKTVAHILNKTGITPQLLELEITEKTIRENENFANQIFKDLQNLGVHLSIDDFGTDYASLSYLQKFPFHTLKIAQSFMKNFTHKPQDLALLSAVMAWGSITKLNIVAEGVETEEQLEFLCRMNVQKIQGYQISAPLTAQNVTQFLRLHFSVPA